MNAFREKIINFISYIKPYGELNLIAFILFAVGLLSVEVDSTFFYIVLMLAFLSCPIFITKLIEEPKEFGIANITIKKVFSFKIKNIGNLFKFSNKNIISVLFKYLKVYALFLIILIVAFTISILTFMGLCAFMLSSFEKSFAASIFLIVISLISIEPLFLLFSSPASLSYMLTYNKGLFKSIIFSHKFSSKVLVKQFISTFIASLLFSPIIITADLLHKYHYAKYCLVVLFFILIINYFIFDLKIRLNTYMEKSNNKKQKLV